MAAAVLLLVLAAVAGGVGVSSGGDRPPVEAGGPLGSAPAADEDEATGGGDGTDAAVAGAAGAAAGGLDIGDPTASDAAAGSDDETVRAALDRATATLAALDGTDGARWESRDAEGDLPRAAVGVLEGYRDGGASLSRAGYLDLLGNVWGCAVTGEDWAEVCVVRETEGGDRCRVFRLHLDARRWEELCER